MSQVVQNQEQIGFWIPPYLRNLIRKARVVITPYRASPVRQPRPTEATERLFNRLRENPHARFVVK